MGTTNVPGSYLQLELAKSEEQTIPLTGNLVHHNKMNFHSDLKGF